MWGSALRRSPGYTSLSSRAQTRGPGHVKRGMFPCVPARPSPTADQALAAVLRSLREAKGATQEEVAFGAGLTTRTLQKIEHGHSSPEWATVRRIAVALGVGLVELAQAVGDAEE